MSLKNIIAKLKNEQKYFCIGRNKTGTTSLKFAFKRLGYSVGNQRIAEILCDKYYFEDKFEPIIKYCRTAEVFQDVPFSYPKTYRYLDDYYPNSKFILTIRDSPEQWYNSLVKFHSKKFGKNGNVPTVEDLKNAVYIRKGFLYNTVKVHGTPDEDPYNKEIMMNHYKEYNESVINYFKDRLKDLLVINLGEKDSYQKFEDFLNIDSQYNDFPWVNKTSNI